LPRRFCYFRNSRCSCVRN